MIICKYVFLSRFNGFFVVHNFEYFCRIAKHTKIIANTVFVYRTYMWISWLIYNNVLFIIQSNMASKNKNYEKKGRERGRDEYENQFYLWNVSTGNVWKEKKIAWSQSHRKADYYMCIALYTFLLDHQQYQWQRSWKWLLYYTIIFLFHVMTLFWLTYFLIWCCFLNPIYALNASTFFICV